LVVVEENLEQWSSEEEMWSEEESWGGEKIWFFLTRKCKFLQMVTLVVEGFCKDNNVHAKDDNPRSSY
jgi:hypothetical protein